MNPTNSVSLFRYSRMLFTFHQAVWRIDAYISKATAQNLRFVKVFSKLMPTEQIKNPRRYCICRRLMV